MKLYSGPLSLFSRKVEIALGEKGLAFERIMVPFTQEVGYQPKHPEVLAVNPKGQVPVLVDGDLSLFDSTLIFEYLEEAYPSSPLMPPMGPGGAAARARCRLRELDADEVLFPVARQLAYRTEAAPADPMVRAANQETGAKVEGLLRDHFARLDRALGDGEFFCGALSVADIAMFMTILWTQRLTGPSLAPYAALNAWYARAGARPPFAKAAAEINAADLALTPELRNH
jgi:glutathione S-transferase